MNMHQVKMEMLINVTQSQQISKILVQLFYCNAMITSAIQSFLDEKISKGPNFFLDPGTRITTDFSHTPAQPQ
jgi:hypothetical protein